VASEHHLGRRHLQVRRRTLSRLCCLVDSQPRGRRCLARAYWFERRP
jgi:hypothetical protein